MAEYKGVLVYGEFAGEKLSEITLALLGCGRRLADDLGEELSVVFMGSGLGGSVRTAAAFGADKICVVDHPLLADYQTDSHVAAMDQVVKQVRPQIIILGQNSVGRDLAPRLAFRLGTAAILDCL
ncbi:MAG: hypothetical protein Q8P24_16690, partial [Desulfobacterales bacterium]|nr:hypothetical protein [Desulfobacterales bacterium]